MGLAVGVLLVTRSTEAVVPWCRCRVTRTSSTCRGSPRSAPARGGGGVPGAGGGGGGSGKAEAAALAQAFACVATWAVVAVSLLSTPPSPLSLLLASLRCLVPPPVSPHTGTASTDGLGKPRTQAPLTLLSSRPPASVPPRWLGSLLGRFVTVLRTVLGTKACTPRCGMTTGSVTSSTASSAGLVTTTETSAILTLTFLTRSTTRRHPPPPRRARNSTRRKDPWRLRRGAPSMTPSGMMPG